jgi:ferric-dicitrate binding protein FerR (iron transport regulator)
MSLGIIAAVSISVASAIAVLIFIGIALYRVVKALRITLANVEVILASPERLIAVISPYLPVQSAPRRRFWISRIAEGAAAALAVPIAAAWVFVLPASIQMVHQPGQQSAQAQQVETPVEQHRLRLEDGTVLLINENSLFSVAFEPDVRKFSVQEGVIRFAVTKDPNRPFVVDTPHLGIRVLGTEFTVHSGSTGTDVQVHEGRVEITHRGVVRLVRSARNIRTTRAEPDGSAVLLKGGDISVGPDGKIHDQIVVNATDKLHTRSSAPMIEFKGERLRNVVAEINRHQTRPFVVVDSDIGEMEIAGFILDPSDRQNVRDYLGVFEVRFEESANGQTLLYSKKHTKRR